MQYIVNAVATGGIYALFTLGLSLCWGALNIFNLAHGAIFMLGALSAYLVAVLVPLPFILSLPHRCRRGRGRSRRV